MAFVPNGEITRAELSPELYQEIDSKVKEVSVSSDKLVVDGKQSKIMTTYTSAVPSTVAVGGLEKGFTADNMNIEEMLFKMLHQYVAPRAAISCTPNGGTYEKGSNVPTVNITATGYREADQLQTIKIMQDNSQLAIKSVAGTGNDTLSHTVSALAVNAKFHAKVTDGKNEVTASSGQFNFVYPYYVGVIAEGATANEATVKALTKRVEGKGNKVLNYTTANQKMVFAYPKAYGNLAKIIDANNFEVTGTFTKTEINITGLDNTAQAYYVYVNKPSTVSNFKMTFNY